MPNPYRGAWGSPLAADQTLIQVWAAVLAVTMLLIGGCAAEQSTSGEIGPETAAGASDEESADESAGGDSPGDGSGDKTDTKIDGDAAEPSGTQTVPDAVPMAADPVRGCTAVEAPEGVNINWWGLPVEADLSIVGNEVTLAVTADRPEGVLTLFGAKTAPGDLFEMKITTSEGTESISCELSAPATDDQPADTTSCPSADSTAQGCDSPIIADGDRADELVAARDHFRATAFGPHAYFVTSIDGVEEDLYLQADGQGGRTFVPPRADTEYLNPFTIHDELLTAIGAGTSVSYQLDPTSGLPVWWTVERRTTKLLCFELDTAPPELRVGPCDPETDLIDR